MFEHLRFRPEHSARLRSLFVIGFLGLVLSVSAPPDAVAREGEVAGVYSSADSALLIPDLGSLVSMPIASDWNRENGYSFRDHYSYLTIKKSSPTPGAIPDVTYEISGTEDLCQQAPGSPFCVANESVAEAYGIPAGNRDDFLRYSVVVPDSALSHVCGAGAAACVLWIDGSYWAVYSAGSVSDYSGAHSVVAHEMTHEVIFEGFTPGDGITNDYLFSIEGEQNVERDRECLQITSSGAWECYANGELTDCVFRDRRELDAVLSTRLYMIAHRDPAGIRDDYALAHREFFGGYEGAFLSGKNLPGYLTRQETIAGLHILLDYFAAHPEEAESWRSALFRGDYQEAFMYSSFAFNGIYNSPESIAHFMSKLNSAMKVYSFMPDASPARITHVQSIESFCGR